MHWAAYYFQRNKTYPAVKVKTTQMQVTDIRRSVFGVFGRLNGREVEWCYATRMWAYLDGSGYAYGAHA